MIIGAENYAENYNKQPIGAKARNLFKLRENGFNVPPFFCVSGEEKCDLERYAADFFGADKLVSVRSSASAEDGASVSFAGQFHTELELRANEISSAVERVRSVPKSEGFSEYCKTNGIDPEKITVCAIVQEMISADLSGVIFTANPQGIINETVAVIGRGTGDNVVEDKAPTSTYYYNTTDGLYYSEHTDNSPRISEAVLKELIEIAEKIKKLFGHECDIEFAIKSGEIFILQARPITSLKCGSPIVLDNSNIVESYPGITLPLTQSFIRTAYYRVFRSVLLRSTHEPKTVAMIDDILRNMVDAASGRIYYRISNWYDVILLLPFSRKIIPVWQEMLGVKNKNVTSHLSRLSRKVGIATHAKVALSFVWLMLACPRLMEKLDVEFKEMIRFFKSVDLNSAGAEEILSHYRNVLDKVTAKWDLTLVNDMYTFIFTGLLKSRLKSDPAKANRLISGLNGIESMKPVTELVKLSRLAKESGELAWLERIHNTADFRAYMKNGKLAQRLAAYIERYGDRNAEELKLESLTFRTNPELLAQKIVQYAEAGTEVPNRSEQKTAPKGLCKALAKRAAVGIKNREKSRLNRSRLYGMMRSMMLKVGEELSAADLISAPRDIFYLEYSEVETAVKSGKDMRSIVERRREMYRRFEKLPAYTRLVFAEKVFDRAPKNVGGMETNRTVNTLEGTPCSAGKAHGEVIVITDPTSCPDTTGKIIVAKMTDPGWVFLIVGAAGIITEKGSLLSHTAIISRELKKPAVVGVDGAASILRNGDTVEVDGASGRITVIESAQNTGAFK